MKRALLVTAGTVTGLVSVLAYSPLDPATAALSEGSGGGLGLGAPPAASPVAAAGVDAGSFAPATAPGSTRAEPGAPGVPVPAPRTAKGTARPVVPASRAVRPTHSAPASSATTSAAPVRVVTRRTPATGPTHAPSVSHPAPKPHPTTPSSKPTPKPTPTPAGPRDYTGSAVTYKYGTLQVAIRVVGGQITDAWAVAYPKGDSLPYSEMAIPILRSQTISAQSAHISGATGASLTSTSWITSLTAALAAAGLR